MEESVFYFEITGKYLRQCWKYKGDEVRWIHNNLLSFDVATNLWGETVEFYVMVMHGTYNLTLTLTQT